MIEEAYRKVWWRLIPFLLLCCVFNYIGVMAALGSTILIFGIPASVAPARPASEG